MPSSQTHLASVAPHSPRSLAAHNGVVTPLRAPCETDVVPERPAAFAELLVELKAGRFTGVLEVNNHKFSTFLHFSSGRPICVELGDPALALGRMLLSRGTITSQQYQAAVTLMTDGMVDSENVKLGECLIKLRILSPAEVYEALSDQAVEKVLSCFRDTEAEFSLAPKEDLASRVPFAADLKTERLILAGFKRHYSTSRLRACLLDVWELYPRLSDAEQIETLLGLGGAERRFLNQVNGRKTIKTLCEETDSLSAHDATALCCALWVTKLSHYAALPAMQAVSDPYTRVASTKSAQNLKVTQVVGKPIAKPAKIPVDLFPERNNKPLLKVAKRPKKPGKAKPHVLSRIHTSKRTGNDGQTSANLPAKETAQRELNSNDYAPILVDVNPPNVSPLRQGGSRSFVSAPLSSSPDWIQSLVRVPVEQVQTDSQSISPSAEAARHFSDGKALLREGRYQDALRQFDLAVELHNEDLCYQLHSAWCAYRLASERQQILLYKSTARDLCVRLVRQKSNEALVQLALGHFLRTEHEPEAARRRLTKAAKLDPANVAIQREIRLLG